MEPSEKQLRLELYHIYHKPYETAELSIDCKEFIDAQLSSSTPSQIYRDLVDSRIPGFDNIAQHQVYYRWKQVNGLVSQQIPNPNVSPQVPLSDEQNQDQSESEALEMDTPAGISSDETDPAQREFEAMIQDLKPAVRAAEEQAAKGNTKFMAEFVALHSHTRDFTSDLRMIESSRTVPSTQAPCKTSLSSYYL
ncbi:uncharacterized protein BROUX77_002268 [Berkeleyomyces rouxiae]|uniref:uncharacterized protein n=1 Tax=Berkeleyomyces rouxiae TaxID=2035830 RepID=UPI003B7B6663